MRTYTVTLRPDSIKGKFRTFVLRPRTLAVFLFGAAAALCLLAWLLVAFVILPYGEVAARHREAVRLENSISSLAAEMAEQEMQLDWLAARVSLELALVEKVNLLLGGGEWRSGGYPRLDGDRVDALLSALSYLERRIEGHERFAEVIELLPIRLPLRGRFEVASGFGRRRSPFVNEIEMHNGIDLAAPYGMKILAAGGGVVSLAGRWSDLKKPEYGRLGLFVRIEHGETGYSTIYGHCASLLVRVGDKVRAGDPIALVGDTGWSTAPHLHFAIARGDRYFDPKDFLLFFDAGVVRQALQAYPLEGDGWGGYRGSPR